MVKVDYARMSGRKRSSTYAYPPKKRARYNSVGPMGTVRSTSGFRPRYGTRSYEKKVNDVATAAYNVNSTGTITLLCLPVLGSDYNNRIGRKISVKSLYIRGRVIVNPAAAPATAVTCNSQQARMMIVWDMQPNGVAPDITDILVEALPSSQLNLNNRDRFKIVKDKIFDFDPYVVVNTATQAYNSFNRCAYPIKMFKKMNQQIIFNGTNGGTIADINSGALYMVWIGTNAAGVNAATAVVSSRVRYTDD